MNYEDRKASHERPAIGHHAPAAELVASVFRLSNDRYLQAPKIEFDYIEFSAVYDWLGALCRHTILRRAGMDAYLALSHPTEAGTFVYRGMEWLVVGEGRSWDDLAADVGVGVDELRGFKKLANVDYGVRHASRSGQKLRADVANYGTWVCALIDAIYATRSRLETGYKPLGPEEVTKAVIAALPLVPYE